MGAEDAPDVSPYCTPPAPDLGAYASRMAQSMQPTHMTRMWHTDPVDGTRRPLLYQYGEPPRVPIVVSSAGAEFYLLNDQTLVPVAEVTWETVEIAQPAPPVRLPASERCAETMQACVGKTIAAVVYLEDAGNMGDGITVRFTDGTSVDLFGEYDEGVTARWSA